MTLLLWTLLILFSSVLLVLSLRWKVSLSGKLYYDKNVFDYSVRALLGGRNRGVGVNRDSKRFTVFLGRAHSPFFTFSLGDKKKTKAKQKPKQKKKRLTNLLGIISATKRSIQWGNLELRGEFGLKDPSQTGKLFGGLMAVGNGLFPHRFQLNIQPNFDRQMADVNCDTAFQFRPTALAWRVGQAYFNINR